MKREMRPSKRAVAQRTHNSFANNEKHGTRARAYIVHSAFIAMNEVENRFSIEQKIVSIFHLLFEQCIIIWELMLPSPRVATAATATWMAVNQRQHQRNIEKK